ncbi:interferon regulatory factor 3-like [Hypanus sabinus]|uniref:interferon regulatory factor 3-like n=1 Tax=Hypanus sabinus TaxID=79690 RepID=UPI0028C4A8C8|nr:interferon regulatory factor 3-like [Hypanus sabinus]
MGKQRMSQQKPQLRPWLIAQIDSGCYQGLCWINEEKNMFRIPWKHASRQDLSEDDYRIFKDWAIASGKFTGQDASDPPKWKTNFRCALNSNDSFKKVADNSKDSSDPHKIYCIVNHNPVIASGVRVGAAETDDELDSILYFSPETEPGRPDFNLLPDPYAQEPVEDVMPHFGLMSLSDSPPDQLDPGAGYPPNFYSQTAVLPGVSQLAQGTAPQEAASQIPTHASSPEQQWEPVMNLSQEGPLHVPAPVSRPPPNQGALSGAEGHLSQLPSDLDITIYYRGRQVLQTTVTNAIGCRLYFQQEDESSAHLQQIRFPGTDDISDYKQKDFTDRLLSNMEGGLLLWHRAGDLMAKRLGKCQVFWASGDVGTSDESQKLNRDVMTRIFCLKDFIQGIVQFTEHRVRAPPCAIFLCFGQHFAGSEQSKKLILVKVVPKVCEFLTEIAHQGGASSLNSENASLQISNAASVDSLYALLQEIEDMEVDL